MWLPFLSAAWERPFSPPAIYKMLHLRYSETNQNVWLKRLKRLTCSDAFPRFCLKLLAFFRDLLKLLILLRMGSGRTLDRRGESEGIGVLLAAATSGDGGFGGKISGEFGGVLGEGGSLWIVTLIFHTYIYLVFILLLQYLHRSSGRASGQHLDSLKSNLKK